jgi:hypothetical protein
LNSLKGSETPVATLMVCAFTKPGPFQADPFDARLKLA